MDKNETTTPETLQKQVEELTQQLAECNEKIPVLEKQIEDRDADLQAAYDKIAALTMAPDPNRATIETKKGLNIRSGPGKDFAILTSLPDGTTVDIQTLPDGIEVPGWALIKVGDYIGWAMTAFLKPLA